MENINKPHFEFSHIGVNSNGICQAKNMSLFLTTMFGLLENEGKDSIFLNKEIEVIKSIGLGKNGHIAFYTPDIKEAMLYLETKGITFNMDSAKYNENNEISIIYIEQEINGFAIHLTNKRKKMNV